MQNPCHKTLALLVSLSFCAVIAGQPLEAQVSVTVGQNFTGSSFDFSTGITPADANGAVGPEYFMEFINSIVAVYNKTNGASVLRKSNLAFWSDAVLIISPDALTTAPGQAADVSSAMRSLI